MQPRRLLALGLVALCLGGAAGGCAPDPRSAQRRAVESPEPGVDDATLTRQLRTIPGVLDVQVRTDDGFDVGRKKTAALRVGSRNKERALDIVDRAMAIMWQAPTKWQVMAYAWMPREGGGSYGVAHEDELPGYGKAASAAEWLTARDGPWPGRGTPPPR